MTHPYNLQNFSKSIVEMLPIAMEHFVQSRNENSANSSIKRNINNVRDNQKWQKE